MVIANGCWPLGATMAVGLTMAKGSAQPAAADTEAGADAATSTAAKAKLERAIALLCHANG
jgi:hypothetical protein